ncbi:NTP transferase domain-containing protein [Desulfuribacillus alkaliarsenatis]|uniref:MobA-like NTP transferase domain-containing protein n=1 Tax=Desulfuribacillus alkaliarsenatis TaxID=766136 RepID=A0A1E5G402_9FIRM|nr:phosphocholine cytidylyltransferase family protein [Desulfuribacillus alkaliarsenatis]OEF97725.1 hypothetical protein BHF68_14095 [Desulfuribacillus alkaliarsenatis]
MVNKAVIVAAGLSSRLYPLTLDTPKGLLKINDETLLLRSIRLIKNLGISEVAVVIGYQSETMIQALEGEAIVIVNPFYQHCNNMGSLWFAKNFVSNQPFLYMHGDIIYDEIILQSSHCEFLRNPYDLHLVTDFTEADEEAMKVKITPENFLVESNKQLSKQDSAGEWTGIAFINNSEAVFAYIEEALLAGNLNVYDTYAFTNMAGDGYKLYCSATNHLQWIEVDFLTDYEKAKRMFTL